MHVGILVGLLGGVVAARLVSRRWRHGGCGHHGRRRGGFLLRRLAWALDLDARQRDEAETILRDVKRAFHDASPGGMRGHVGALADELGEVFGNEGFDRARAEKAADARGEAFARVRKAFVDGLERLHAILTPSQRERLREIVAHRFGGRWHGPVAAL